MVPWHRVFQPEEQVPDSVHQEAGLYHSKGMEESWVGAHLSIIRVERLLGNHTNIFEN